MENTIAKLYDNIAEKYNLLVNTESQTQLSSILIDAYTKSELELKGSVLDLVCGTGIAAESMSKIVNSSFNFIGVDLSKRMISQVSHPYKKLYVEDMLTFIKNIPSKSIDHVVALSTVYFLNKEEFNSLMEEIYRVTKKSFFVTCEQFSDELIHLMKEENMINLYSHKLDLEPFYEGFLWRSMSFRKDIYGYCYMKKL